MPSPDPPRPPGPTQPQPSGGPSSTYLDLHDVGLLLADGHLGHLGVGDHADHAAVLLQLHAGEQAGQGAAEGTRKWRGRAPMSGARLACGACCASKTMACTRPCRFPPRQLQQHKAVEALRRAAVCAGASALALTDSSWASISFLPSAYFFTYLVNAFFLLLYQFL